MDVGGREDIDSGLGVIDDPAGIWGVERLDDLPRGGYKELLQYLNARAALTGIPHLLDQGP
jgi:hypothetical protein